MWDFCSGGRTSSQVKDWYNKKKESEKKKVYKGKGDEMKKGRKELL